jgi:hypothetical protein
MQISQRSGVGGQPRRSSGRIPPCRAVPPLVLMGEETEADSLLRFHFAHEVAAAFLAGLQGLAKRAGTSPVPTKTITTSFIYYRASVALAAIYGPVPLAEVTEYLGDLETIGILQQEKAAHAP